MSTQTIKGFQFQYVCEIVPQCHADRMPRELMPQRRYKNPDDLPLHRYGKGPFCKFTIPREWNDEAGVYAILVDGQTVYVGETDDLGRRFNLGYGNISPRNRFKGGQPTNCRVNNLILNAYKEGSSVRLLFRETADRFGVEATLLAALRPEWNLAAGSPSERQRPARREPPIVPSRGAWAHVSPRGKYRPLFEYLMASQNDCETLSYHHIEDILGSTLPPSAHEYRQWWGNGHHTQARAWLAAGWKVTRVTLGRAITFERTGGLPESH